jgi:general secretion pathway protein M
MMSAIENWFGQLLPRERILVLVATGLIVVSVIYLAGIKPLYSGATETATRVADKEVLLQQLQQAAARVAPATSNTPVQGSNQSIVVIIDRTTRIRNLSPYLKRNQPDGKSGVRLRFENAPFDELVTWIAELESGYGMSTSSTSIDGTGAPGRVNCSIVLTRQGS